MDDIALDYYDPRNAPFWPTVAGWRPAPRVQSPPIVGPRMQAPPTVGPRMQAAPMYAAQAYPPAGYYPAPAYAPRRSLRDLSLADVLPLVAQVFAALRPLPQAPDDRSDTNTNVVNQTRFLGAIASHFKADQQLAAAGSVLGKLLG